MNRTYFVFFLLLFIKSLLIAQQPKAIEVQTGKGTTTIKVYPGIKSEEVYSPEEKRFALVMGVSDYDYLNQLPCVKNDVDTVRRALQNTGFDVAVALDKTKAEFEAIIDESRQYCIDNGYNIITVYYSGHGAQFNNVQMLAPKDFQFSSADTSGKLKEFMENTILLPTVIGKLNIPNAKAVLAISDACRSEDYLITKKISSQIAPDLILRFNNIGRALEGTGNVGVLYSSLNGATSATAPVISVFTQYLLSVLAKKPGNFSDLAIKIRSEMLSKGEKQKPVNTNNPIEYDFKFFRTSSISQFSPSGNPSKVGVIFITDDGYKAVKIGNQIWMAENLDVEKYVNGDLIPQIQNAEDWKMSTSGAWCYYDNDSLLGKKYGKLYNWHAINDARLLAPPGWHIPSTDEWNILNNNLSANNTSGAKLKNKIGWNTNINNNNITGFCGLPSGRRNHDGTFGFIGTFAGWWASIAYNSLSAWLRVVEDSNDNLASCYYSKRSGLAVRCIKD